MNKKDRIELLSGNKTRVTRIKSEVYELVESYCKEADINIGVYISNAILEKLENDKIVEFK